MLSNDHLVPKDRMISPDTTEHTVDRVFAGDFKEAPAWPLLAAFTLLLFCQIFGSAIMSCMTWCFPSLEIGDISLDEDIDNYWAALDEKDRNWAMKEDQHATEKLGL